MTMEVRSWPSFWIHIFYLFLRSVQCQTPTPTMDSMQPGNTSPGNMGSTQPLLTPTANTNSMPPINTPTASTETFESPTQNVNSMEPFGSSSPNSNSMEPSSSLSSNSNRMEPSSTLSLKSNSMEPSSSPSTNSNSMDPSSSPPPAFNSMEPTISPSPTFNSVERSSSLSSNSNSMEPSSPPFPKSSSIRPSTTPFTNFNNMELISSPSPTVNSMEPSSSPPASSNSIEPSSFSSPFSNSMESFSSHSPVSNSVEPFFSPSPNSNSMEPSGSPPQTGSSVGPFFFSSPTLNSAEPSSSVSPNIDSMEPSSSPPASSNSIESSSFSSPFSNSMESFSSQSPVSNSVEPFSSPSFNSNSMEPKSSFSMGPSFSPSPTLNSVEPSSFPPPTANSMEPSSFPPVSSNSIEPSSFSSPFSNSMGPFSSQSPVSNSVEPFFSPSPNSNSMEPSGTPPQTGSSMGPFFFSSPTLNSVEPSSSVTPNINSMEPSSSPPASSNSIESSSFSSPFSNSMESFSSPSPVSNSVEPFSFPSHKSNSMEPSGSPPQTNISVESSFSPSPTLNSMEPSGSLSPNSNSMEPSSSPPPSSNSIDHSSSSSPFSNSVEPFFSPTPTLNSLEPSGSLSPKFSSVEPFSSPSPNSNSIDFFSSPSSSLISMETSYPPSPDFNSIEPSGSPSLSISNSIEPSGSLSPNFNSIVPFSSPSPTIEPVSSPSLTSNNMEPSSSPLLNIITMEPSSSKSQVSNSMGPSGSSSTPGNGIVPTDTPSPKMNSMEPSRSPHITLSSMEPLNSPPPNFSSMEPFRSTLPNTSRMKPATPSMDGIITQPRNVNTMAPNPSLPQNGKRPDETPSTTDSTGFSSPPTTGRLRDAVSIPVTSRFREEIKYIPAVMVLSMIQGDRENTVATRNLLQTDLISLFEESRCRDSFRSVENITVISDGPSYLVRFEMLVQLGDRCSTFDYLLVFNSTLTGPNQDTFGSDNVVVKNSFSFDLITTRANLTFRSEDSLDTQLYLDPFGPEALALERNIIVGFQDLSSTLPTFSHATFIPPFIAGSLIGVFSLSFLQSEPIPTSDLRSSLANLRRQGNFNFPGFTLQEISVEEVCPATFVCLNGGICVPDISFRSICSCTPDWQGDRCQRPVITAENVATASGMYASMTQQMNPMNVTVDDVQTAAEVVQDIADLGVTDVQTTQNVVQIVNNVLNANESVIMEATSTQGQITRSLEQQLINVNISQDESFSVSLPNVAVEALDVSPQKVRTFGVASFSSDTESQSSSISDEVDVVDDTLTDDELVVFSSLEEVSDVDRASTYLQFPDNFAGSILDQESLRAVFLVYRRPTLFNSQWLQNVNQNATQYTKSANTRVLSATLTNNGREITFVPGFIEQRFMPLETEGKIFNPVCVFWDYEADGGNGNWSSDGCYYKGMTRDGQILCRCDHLTNFAVLMDIYGQGTIDPAQEKVLEILSFVGCGVSIVGLITTIAVYISQKKLRKLQPSKILVGLCVALLGLYFSFIATAISNTIGLGKVPCSIVAAVFHFFALNALAWMGVEGVNMYLLFVKVFNTYIKGFMYKAVGFATGVPLLIVAVTVAVTRNGYTRQDFCFLDKWPLIFGVITPVGVIVTVNFIIFVLVIRQLLKSKAVKKSEKVKKRQNLKRARNALSIMSLIGLTWSLGFLSLVYVLSGPIQWLFTIVNSTQGFMIFMLYCVRHPTVVTYWKKRCPCCEVEAPGYTPSNTHSNSQMNPNSKSNGFTPSSVPVTSVEENRQSSGYR